MNLQTNEEVKEFFDIVHSCKGHVELRSQEGDVFNLRSTLTRYVAPGILLSERGRELELFCSNKEDEARFINFFHNNPTTIH